MKDRYSRQILFPQIGKKGQGHLQKAHVLIVGVGALGSQSAEALARAGVGKLTLIDRDYVEASNLQRQSLYTEEDVQAKLPKAIAAQHHLEKINSEIAIDAHVLDLTPIALDRFAKKVDLILDGTDNFDVRMMINDYSQKRQIPWIYGSCVGSYALTYTILPGKTPCLHCLLGEIPIGGETCDTAGIIQAAAAQVVVHQTTEAMKLLTKQEESLRKTLLAIDLWKNEIVQMDLAAFKKKDCPSCGTKATYPYLTYDESTKAVTLCGRDAVQIRPATFQERDLQEVSKRLQGLGGKVEGNEFLLSFTLGQHRMVLFKDGRAIIHGTKNLSEAKKIYYRYFS